MACKPGVTGGPKAAVVEGDCDKMWCSLDMTKIPGGFKLWDQYEVENAIERMQFAAASRAKEKAAGKTPRPVEINLLGFTEKLLENTDGGGAPISVFPRGGSLLPFIYADARYIDAVIAF